MLPENIYITDPTDKLLNYIYDNINIILSDKTVYESYSPDNNNVTHYFFYEQKRDIEESYAMAIYVSLKLLEYIN